MKSHVLYTVWCDITDGSAGEVWTSSLSGVKGLMPISTEEWVLNKTTGMFGYGCALSFLNDLTYDDYPFHSQVQKVHSPKPSKEKCISDAVRIGSIIIWQLNKLWKAKFFTLCDIMFLVRPQEKFDIDHSGRERVKYVYSRCNKIKNGKSFRDRLLTRGTWNKSNSPFAAPTLLG